MTESREVWPVLIVNGRLLVAPDFLMDQAASDASINGILIREINPGKPPVAETVRTRTFRVPRVGDLTAYFRFNPVTGELVERPTEFVRDEATRIQHMIEGVVTRTAAAGEIGSELIDASRSHILHALKEYLNDPSSWPAAERSSPILISDIIAAPAGERGPKQNHERDAEHTDEPTAGPGAYHLPDDTSVAVEPQPGPNIWPPVHIVAILLVVGAIVGIILWELLHRILG
ncbi:MAG: hypothetical protein JO115_17975 [Pseudonocardiales bacterium]|nr:hypothetical protein [Pseudonocardiales bacterium]